MGGASLDLKLDKWSSINFTFVIQIITVNLMRSIVNISLPRQLSDVVEKTVASGQYASKSEFFRSLLRAWMEGRLKIELQESRKELRGRKGKLLNSLKDLR